jgi:hypothetical protein
VTGLFGSTAGYADVIFKLNKSKDLVPLVSVMVELKIVDPEMYAVVDTTPTTAVVTLANV